MRPNESFTIKVVYVNPPIPTRQFDWLAYVEGQEESRARGISSEPFEAVTQLIELLEEI